MTRDPRGRAAGSRRGRPALGTAVLAAAAAGAVAFAVVGYGTGPPGPGLDPDAMSYLGAAVSLAHDGDYRIPSSSWSSPDTTEPLSHFPPGFSTAIAGPVALGARPTQAARWIEAAAAACTWAGIVLIVAGAAGTLAGLLTAVAALATPALLNAHLSVLSEPVFLTALVATVAGVIGFTGPGASGATSSAATRRWTSAWLTGCAVAAAVMLRYAGIAVLGAAALLAMRGPVGPVRHGSRIRALRTLAVVFPTACTLAPWIARTVRLGGSRSVRSFGTYGDFVDTLREGANTVTDWLVPAGAGPWRYAVALTVAVSLTALVLSRLPRRDAAAGPAAGTGTACARALGTIGVCYLALLVVSRLFADPNIPFDERILAPLICLAEIGVGIALAGWWRSAGRGPRLAAAVLLVAWLVGSAVRSWGLVAYARDDGNDFAGSDWRESPTIAWVRAPDGGLHRVLYSNWPAALYFHAGRAAHDVPAVADALTLHRFRDRLQRSGGVVVGFTTPSPDVVDPAALARALGLRLVARYPDGAVWALGGPTPPP